MDTIVGKFDRKVMRVFLHAYVFIKEVDYFCPMLLVTLATGDLLVHNLWLVDTYWHLNNNLETKKITKRFV